MKNHFITNPLQTGGVKIILASLLVNMTLTLSAETATSGGVIYEYYDQYNCRVIGIAEDAVDVVINPTWEGRTVSEIQNNIFANHSKLRSVAINSSENNDLARDLNEFGQFANCPALVSVKGLSRMEELPAEYFLNCPSLQLGDLSWLPEGITKINYNAFKIENAETPVQSGSITIPANINEIAYGAFSGREFTAVTLPYSEKPLSTNDGFDTKAYYLERSMTDHRGWGATDILETVINKEHAITTLPTLGENLRELRLFKLTSDNYYTFKGENLSVIALGSSSLGGISVSEAPNLQILNMSGADCGEVKLENLGENADITYPKTMTSFQASGLSCTSIDLSDVELVDDENTYTQTVNVFSCPNLVTLKAPWTGKYELSYNQLTKLEYVSCGADITGTRLSGRLNKHDFIYAGTVDRWAEISHSSYSLDEIGNNGSTWPGDMSWIDHFYYGYQSPQTFLTELSLDNSTAVTPCAFMGYERLTSVTASDKVKTIGQGAFANCANVKKIDINAEVLEPFSFYNCSAVESVTLGSKLNKVIATAFDGCGKNAGTTVNYLGTPTQWCKIDFTTTIYEINGTVMQWVARYTTISPTAIADAGFLFNGKALEEITLDEEIPVLCKTALSNLSTLTKVTFYRNYPAEFQDYCLMGCVKLKYMEVANSAASRANDTEGIKVGYRAFAYDADLTEIPFADNIVELGNEALLETGFNNAQPDGVLYLGTLAYGYKGEVPADGTVTIKEGTTAINTGAFSESIGIKNFIFPNTLVNIGSQAFDGVAFEGTITIPASVLNINTTMYGQGVTVFVFEDSETPVTLKGSSYYPNLKEVYLGRYGTQSVLGFDDNVTKLTLGKYIDHIDFELINHKMYNVTTLCVNSTTPPTLETESRWMENPATGNFEEMTANPLVYFNKATCRLVVPEGCAEAYSKAEGWREFFNIAGVESIETESADVPAEYYTLQGVRVMNPTSGVYIVKRGNSVTKQLIR